MQPFFRWIILCGVVIGAVSSNVVNFQQCRSCVDEQLSKVIDKLLLVDISTSFPSGFKPCSESAVIACSQNCIHSSITFNPDSKLYANNGSFYGCSHHILFNEFSSLPDMRCNNKSTAIDLETVVHSRNCVCNTKDCNAPPQAAAVKRSSNASVTLASGKDQASSSFPSKGLSLLLLVFAFFINY